MIQPIVSDPIFCDSNRVNCRTTLVKISENRLRQDSIDGYPAKLCGPPREIQTCRSGGEDQFPSFVLTTEHKQNIAKAILQWKPKITNSVNRSILDANTMPTGQLVPLSKSCASTQTEQDAKTELLELVTRKAAIAFVSNVRVAVTGSSLHQADICGSDLDLVVAAADRTTEFTKDQLVAFFNEFKKGDKFCNLVWDTYFRPQLISGTYKYYYESAAPSYRRFPPPYKQRLDLKFDIWIGNKNSLQTCTLLQAYCKYPAIRHAGRLLKMVFRAHALYGAKEHGIGGEHS